MDICKRTAVNRFSITNLLVAFLLICCTALLVRSAPPDKLEQIKSSGELRVLSRNGPISHYQGSDGLTGFEYTLLKGFADELGVKLILEDGDQVSSILQTNDESKFDLISPSVIASHALRERFQFSAPFMELDLHLIYNSSQTAPSNVADLAGKSVTIVNKSSIALPLPNLQESFADIKWNAIDNVEMIDLLEMVERGHVQYAVVDSAIFNIYRYSYPHARSAFNLNLPQPLAWAFTPSRDTSLYNAAQKYLQKIKYNGQLTATSAHFFEQFIESTTNDAVMFNKRFEQRFPLWEESIKAAAAKYNLDWQLVAAIGYQESQWIPNAESPTGVRGFMMLTPGTAKELGVQNLDDPHQSIQGGAKYMRYLLDNLPDHIQGDDRLYMALAAYNQGIGHLQDARVLTKRMKGDPSSWADVSRYFPLLAKR
ncbi:MAG: membrane-bound lytic murein transglycosylase MltF [Moraxellaceae bacterium]|nr:MAG: membrane-bound lytic murein transglycosylase MltF [Moraxellaceae bacterium]